MEYIIRQDNNYQFSVIKFDGQPLDEYHLIKGNSGYKCSCPDAVYRKHKCKHTKMVKECIARGVPQPFIMEI